MLIASGRAGLTKLWSEYASKVSYEDLSPAVVRSAKAVIADTVAVMLAGSGMDRACRLVQQLATPGAGPAESTLIGYGRRAPVLLAAMINGSTAHVLNYDSVGRDGGHVAVSSVPGPLAVAERRGRVSGRCLLTAVTVAADLSVRLAEAVDVGPDRFNQWFTEGQLFGYFAVAAASGHILGLTPKEIDGALGFALMEASGGSSQPSSEGKEAKGLYGGFSNYGGVLSALLAAEGVDAGCAAFEGERGLFEAFFGGRCSYSAMEDGLGKEFRILDAQIKLWPTSVHLHPFVAAALKLRKDHDLRPEHIQCIVVDGPSRLVPWAEPADDRRHPRNIATATNSIPFAVAAALANGGFTLSDVTGEELVRDEILRLADACEYSPSRSENQDDGAIEVTSKDSARISVSFSMAHRDRVPPLTSDLIESKFRDCARRASATPHDERVEKLLDLLDHLEDLDDVRTLTHVLVAT